MKRVCMHVNKSIHVVSVRSMNENVPELETAQYHERDALGWITYMLYVFWCLNVFAHCKASQRTNEDSYKEGGVRSILHSISLRLLLLKLNIAARGLHASPGRWHPDRHWWHSTPPAGCEPCCGCTASCPALRLFWPENYFLSRGIICESCIICKYFWYQFLRDIIFGPRVMFSLNGNNSIDLSSC